MKKEISRKESSCMKKYFSIILIICLVFTFSACTVVNARNSSTQQNVKTTSLTVQDTSALKIEETTETSSFFTTTEVHSETSFHTTQKVKVNAEKLTTSPATTSFFTTEPTCSETTICTTISITKKPHKTAPVYYPDRDTMELFDLVNQYRKDNGIEPLSFDAELSKLAYVRATEQLKAKGHTRPDETRFNTIYDEYGYEYNGAGENIAIGTEATPERMMNGWINSKTHNENMLKTKWTRAGIGLYTDSSGRDYFVLLFAY